MIVEMWKTNPYSKSFSLPEEDEKIENQQLKTNQWGLKRLLDTIEFVENYVDAYWREVDISGGQKEVSPLRIQNRRGEGRFRCSSYRSQMSPSWETCLKVTRRLIDWSYRTAVQRVSPKYRQNLTLISLSNEHCIALKARAVDRVWHKFEMRIVESIMRSDWIRHSIPTVVLYDSTTDVVTGLSVARVCRRARICWIFVPNNNVIGLVDAESKREWNPHAWSLWMGSHQVALRWPLCVGVGYISVMGVFTEARMYGSTIHPRGKTDFSWPDISPSVHQYWFAFDTGEGGIHGGKVTSNLRGYLHGRVIPHRAISQCAAAVNMEYLTILPIAWLLVWETECNGSRFRPPRGVANMGWWRCIAISST